MAISLEDAVDQLSSNLAQLGEKLGGRDAATEYLITQIEQARNAFATGAQTQAEAEQHIEQAMQGFDAHTQSQAVQAFGRDPNLFTNEQLATGGGPSEQSVVSLLTEIRDLLRSGAGGRQQAASAPVEQQPRGTIVSRALGHIGRGFLQTRAGARGQRTFRMARHILGGGRSGGSGGGRVRDEFGRFIPGDGGAAGGAGAGGDGGAAGSAGAGGAGGAAGVTGVAEVAPLGPVGLAIAGIAAAGVVCWELAKAGRNLAYAQERQLRALSEYSPHQAIGIAQLDVARIGRQMQMGQAEAASGKELTDSINRFETALQPLEIMFDRLMNTVGARLLDVGEGLVEIVTVIVKPLEIIAKYIPDINKTELATDETFGQWAKGVADEWQHKAREHQDRINRMAMWGKTDRTPR